MNGIAKPNRPRWVWFILVSFFVTAAVAALSWYLVWAGKISLDAAATTYYRELSIAHYLVSGSITLAFAAGVVQLFMLKKEALNWLSGALVASVAHSLWGVFHENLLHATSLFNVFAGWGYWFLVCRYTSRLTDRGVLH